jgi:hypothetical protein
VSRWGWPSEICVARRRPEDRQRDVIGAWPVTTPSTRPPARPLPPRESSVEAAVRYLRTGFWPARRIRSLSDLDEQYRDWRDRVANRRRHATGRFPVAERLAEERRALRPLALEPFDYAYARDSRVPLDGYLRYRGAFYRVPEGLTHQRVALRASRDSVWICHRGQEPSAIRAPTSQLAPRGAHAPRADGPASAGGDHRSRDLPARALRVRGAVRVSAQKASPGR